MKVSRTTVSRAGRTSGRATDQSYAQLPGAIEAGGAEQVLRKLEEELPEDEDRRRVDGERQDHPDVGVRQAVHPHDHDVNRDDQQLERHDLDEQHHREEGASAAEAQPGQRIAGEQPEDHRAEQDSPREDARVRQGP